MPLDQLPKSILAVPVHKFPQQLTVIHIALQYSLRRITKSNKLLAGALKRAIGHVC